jgi:hypothetical protein
MRGRGFYRWWFGAVIGVVAALGAGALGACATGVDPERPGSGGAGSASSTIASVGPGASVSSSDSASSSAVSSSASSAVSSSVASSTAASSTAASSTAASSTAASSGTGGAPATGLHLEYLCADTTASTTNMKPHFKIVNGGTSSVPYASLSIRYFLTAEGNPPLVFECDYATLGCGNLQGAFSTWTGTNADHDFELTFKAGLPDLAPGTDSGEMQPRLHNQDYSLLTQGNDYSFDPTKTSFTTSTQVTLYQNGVLVWGTEP